MKKLFNALLLMSAIFIITATNGLGSAIETAKSFPTDKTVVIIANDAEYSVLCDRFNFNESKPIEVVNPESKPLGVGCFVPNLSDNDLLYHKIHKERKIERSKRVGIICSGFAGLINESFIQDHKLERSISFDEILLSKLFEFEPYQPVNDTEEIYEISQYISRKSYWHNSEPKANYYLSSGAREKLNFNRRVLLNAHYRV